MKTRYAQMLNPFQFDSPLDSSKGATRISPSSHDTSRAVSVDEPLFYLPSVRPTPGPTLEPNPQKETFSSANSAVNGERFSAVVLPKFHFDTREKFICLQSFEGSVLKVLTDSFIARLVNMTGSKSDAEAEIFRSEVSDEDELLVEPGAIFYWYLGYVVKEGQRIRASAIRFRRLPVWSKKELERAEKEALELREQLGWK